MPPAPEPTTRVIGFVGYWAWARPAASVIAAPSTPPPMTRAIFMRFIVSAPERFLDLPLVGIIPFNGMSSHLFNVGYL